MPVDWPAEALPRALTQLNQPTARLVMIAASGGAYDCSSAMVTTSHFSSCPHAEQWRKNDNEPPRGEQKR